MTWNVRVDGASTPAGDDDFSFASELKFGAPKNGSRTTDSKNRYARSD